MKKVLFLLLLFISVVASVSPMANAESSLSPDVKTYTFDGITYYMYVPENVKSDTPIFVSVHGISRNAEEHANFYVPYAKEQGVISIAPLFPEDTYPDYQTLEQGSDAALDKVIDHAKSISGTSVNKIHLSGSSGGAQFAHRYMLKHPEKVERLAVSAAGFYTFPDPNTNYWIGIRYSGFNPDEFLKVPSMVIVGELDNETEGSWNDNPKITAQQGAGRHARGQNWIHAMRQAAQERGLSTTYTFESLPGVGHDFGAQDMCARIFHFMFPPKEKKAYAHNILWNGSFETGDLTNWYEWKPIGQTSKQRVFASDAFDGGKKVDFYSANRYQQGIYQVLSHVENGQYEVSAYVKQTGGAAQISRMEVYKYGGHQVNVDITQSDIYHKISTVVDVSTGELGVGFYVNSSGGTRLKIDKVEVKKVVSVQAN